MKTTRVLRGVVFAAATGLLFAAVQVRADVFMKQKVHTDAFDMMGRSEPAKDATIVMWLTEDKARFDHDDGTSWLFYGDKRIFYRIDHNKREYAGIPLNFKILFKGAAGNDTQKAKGTAKRPGFMNMSAKVTKTKETKMIGAWNCRKYLVQMSLGMAGTVTSESWVTEDIKIDYAMAFATTHAMLSVMSGFEDFLKEMMKIKGVVVYETSKTRTMRGEAGTTTKELVEYTETAAPAGTYDIPAGYKKIESLR